MNSQTCGCSAQSSCCGKQNPKQNFQTTSTSTPAGSVPTVSTTLNWADRFGHWKARFGWGRMHFLVNPGLYAIGNPNENAPVLVTANYKMTFDIVRSQLSGIDAWILVLDTKSINVWCAAGKGTFGTDELVRRIEGTHLAKIVNHRNVILPQLGAVGVAAHEVKKQIGFNVKYGPVYAKDIPAYLRNGQKAEPAMREIRFGMIDRLPLIPLEIITFLKWSAIPVALLSIIFLILGMSFSESLFRGIILGFTAIISGTAITPLLLPFIPGRAFTIKGAIIGILTSWIATTFFSFTGFLQIGLIFMMSTLTSFLALNFTGSTTFTSNSGVQKEILKGIPILIGTQLLGLILVFI